MPIISACPDLLVHVLMVDLAGGHKVSTEGGGVGGVDAARRERPDLVLMDLSLPVLSGWEATKEIKKDPGTAGIPVVAVTAHAMHGDRERALAAGCDGFIPKPIDGETFEPLVRSYLRSASEEPVPTASGDSPPAETKP